jgi:hypothetical protein
MRLEFWRLPRGHALSGLVLTLALTILGVFSVAAWLWNSVCIVAIWKQISPLERKKSTLGFVIFVLLYAAKTWGHFIR